jgi:FkbM family methyltransferase
MRPIDRLVALAMRNHVRGAGRVAHVLYGQTPGRGVPTTLNGMRWEADPREWIDQQILASGTYEPEISELLTKLCGVSGVLWDVGAHVGVHAVTVATRCPRVRVLAFEPSPVQFGQLCRNATLNGVQIRASCIALAAGSRGYRELSVFDVGNSGLNSLVPWPEVTYSRTITIWCDTGDNLLQTGLPPPTVLKVDVEGGEAGVFTGMTSLLRREELRYVVFESREGASEPNGPARDRLTSVGFAIERLQSTGGGGGDWLASR